MADTPVLFPAMVGPTLTGYLFQGSDVVVFSDTVTTETNRKCRKLLVTDALVGDYYFVALDANGNFFYEGWVLGLVDNTTEQWVFKLVAGIEGTIRTLDALDTAQDVEHDATQAAIAALNDPTAVEIDTELTSNHGSGSWSSAGARVFVSASAVAATALSSTGRITLRQYNDVSFQLTDLGSLAGRTKLYFAIKENVSDTDDEAILLAEENDGVLKVNGATPGDSSGVTFTVDDETTGDITIEIEDDINSQLSVDKNLYYQIKKDDEELLDYSDSNVRVDIRPAVIQAVT